jgi:hypothetical protein
MTNPYYNGGAFPATGAPATSASMRAELASISTGFDKLPTLSGNANKLVTVNSSGTALEAVSVLPSLTITDTNLVVEDNADSTRKFRFEASGITAGATRVLTIPDASTTLVGTDAVQTLTNKTINLTSNLFTATSAQLAAAVTDETGTGSLVFGTNPTISDATLGGTVTLSAGTANGVTYLNGSKVLTSGSALTFDGGILTAPQLRTTNTAGAIFNTSTGAYAQWQYNAAAVGDIGTANQVVGSGATTDFAITSRGASGNLVFGINTSEQMRLTSTGLGIGTSSPGAKLEVNVPGTTGTSSALRLSRGIGYGTTDFKQYYTSGTDYGLTIGNTVSDYLTLNLASGNLGLGVTPSAWSGVTALQVSGTAALYATNTVTGLSFNQYFNGTNNIYLQNNYSNRLQMDSGAFKFFTAPSGTAGNAISFTQAMTLDASGNLAVGTSTTTNAKIFSFVNDATLPGLGVRQDGAGPIQIWQGSGGNERARITSGGDLLVGTTSGTFINGKGIVIADATAARLKLADTDAGVGVSNGLELGFGGATGSIYNLENGALLFGTNNTERARITSGGDLLVGTTAAGYGLFNEQRITVNPTNDGIVVAPLRENYSAYTLQADNNTGTRYAIYIANGSSAGVGTISFTSSATAYNTTSDHRLKDNQQPLTGSGAFIDALQPKTWNWKIDGSKGVGFIAHEVQAVSPSSVVGEKDAVDADGKPVMQAMEYGSAEFIANIIAEIQSLRARVAALEA